MEFQAEIISQRWLHDHLGEVVHRRHDGDNRQQRGSDRNNGPEPYRYPFGIRMVFHGVFGSVNNLVDDHGRDHQACRDVKGGPIRRGFPFLFAGGVPRPAGDVRTDGDSGQPPGPVIHPARHEGVSGNGPLAGKRELPVAPDGPNRLGRRGFHGRELGPGRGRDPAKHPPDFRRQQVAIVVGPATNGGGTICSAFFVLVVLALA
mmetsp:Transcript_20955/g.43943  ORF Transcript_20955/g.43943 Transcript_20955/m.43943 type:complete len:204 (+) Transcript_20955:3375-3986(+)